jgi:hypothetical protein
MKNIIIVMGFSFLMAGFASAHSEGSTVNIQNVEKVIVKHGMSNKEVMHHKMHAMKCLMALKHHANAEEAIEAAMEHIDKHCKDEAKCEKKKEHAAKKIHACFAGAKFVKEYLGSEKEE